MIEFFKVITILIFMYFVIFITNSQIKTDSIDNNLEIEKKLKYLFIENFTQKIEFNVAFVNLNKEFITQTKKLKNINFNNKIQNKLSSFLKKIENGNILLLRKEFNIFKNSIKNNKINTTNNKKIEYIEAKIKAREKNELPHLRKSYAVFLKNKYKNKYIFVKTEGYKNKTIILDWYFFASKSKREEFKNTLFEELKDFGFSKLILQGKINNKFYKSEYKIL